MSRQRDEASASLAAELLPALTDVREPSGLISVVLMETGVAAEDPKSSRSSASWTRVFDVGGPR